MSNPNAEIEILQPNILTLSIGILKLFSQADNRPALQFSTVMKTHAEASQLVELVDAGVAAINLVLGGYFKAYEARICEANASGTLPVVFTITKG